MLLSDLTFFEKSDNYSIDLNLNIFGFFAF